MKPRQTKKRWKPTSALSNKQRLLKLLNLTHLSLTLLRPILLRTLLPMLLKKKRESVVSLIQELFALFEAEVKKVLLKKKKSNKRLRASKNFRKTLRNTLDQMEQFRSKIRVSMEYLRNSFEKIPSLEERKISIQRTTKTLSYGRRSVPRRESDQS
jgi:hypothetical protein